MLTARHMNTISRIFLSACLGALLLFCVFGFLATFEPITPSARTAFRLIYGAGGLAAILGLAAVWRGRRSPRPGQGGP